MTAVEDINDFGPQFRAVRYMRPHMATQPLDACVLIGPLPHLPVEFPVLRGAHDIAGNSGLLAMIIQRALDRPIQRPFANSPGTVALQRHDLRIIAWAASAAQVNGPIVSKKGVRVFLHA